MNFALGHAFNTPELFLNFDNKKLKMSCNDCEELTNDRHRNMLAMKIFKESVDLVLNDIIDNNVLFELPTGSRKAEIHVKRTTGDDFVQARQNGKWRDVDFLSSFFSGYQLELLMYNREGKPVRAKPIYVDKQKKDKLTENTNKGIQYC